MYQQVDEMTVNWKPIVLSSSPMADRAWESIRAIAWDILNRSYPPPSILPRDWHSVYEDALLLAYMARCTAEVEWGERCVSRLNEAIEQSHGRMRSFSLFGGLGGLGWTVEHVSRVLDETFAVDREFSGEREAGTRLEEAEGSPQEDLNEEIDGAFIKRLRMPVQRGLFDLIHGLVGYGTYFLERWPRGSSEEGLELVIHALEKIAEDVDAGTTWFSAPATIPVSEREQCPEGYYNFGVAHGVPAVVHFLYQVSMTGIAQAPVRSLLDRALNWLLARADLQKVNGLRFPSWVTPDGEIRSARPTWCYGDLGVAALLFQVGEGIGNLVARTFALEMLEDCVKMPVDLYRIDDAGLCHGATGVAHIYNRMYQSEGDCRFQTAALDWYERALSMFRPGTGVGGYCKWAAWEGKSGWEPWPAFLDGSIGVALALLGAVTSVEPQWDRKLLLSSRFSDSQKQVGAEFHFRCPSQLAS